MPLECRLTIYALFNIGNSVQNFLKNCKGQRTLLPLIYSSRVLASAQEICLILSLHAHTCIQGEEQYYLLIIRLSKAIKLVSCLFQIMIVTISSSLDFSFSIWPIQQMLGRRRKQSKLVSIIITLFDSSEKILVVISYLALNI